jgi:class 3 adenylate cyclase/DNA-binding NarL/FixJ family response regulator
VETARAGTTAGHNASASGADERVVLGRRRAFQLIGSGATALTPGRRRNRGSGFPAGAGTAPPASAILEKPVTRGLPSGTITFLFTDIEGSTRLLKRLGEDYAALLREHHKVFRTIFERHGGREVDTQGDAFFVAFSRAKDAVAAALDGQRAVAAHSWPQQVDVRVRMGMHTGEPALADERYIGLGVHRAARICSAAHGGQILLSHATYAVLVDDVLPDLRFRDLGEHTLKDLDRPERIYQLVVPDLPSDFAPPRTMRSAESESTEMETGERVVVADDSVLVREGLVRLLRDAGFAVVGTATNAGELLQRVAELRPSVVITDIRMPPTQTDEGLVAAQEIRRLYPEVAVLVLSQHVEPRYATRLLEDYPERAGYLLKDRVSDIAVLADAIRRVADGECVLDPTIVSRLMNRRRRGGVIAALTDPEQELLTLLAEGHSNDTIAERLGIEPAAVEKDVAALFAKLEIGTSPNDVRRVLAVLASIRS